MSADALPAGAIMRVRVSVQAPLTTGPTPTGEARVIPFVEGSFEGPDLRGELLPGGTDWQRVREDGALEIRAHYMLRTEQDETIEVISEGIRWAPPDVLEQLAVGADVAPDAYYFRTFIRLSTAAARLSHMNQRLFYGVGVRKARDVEITVHPIP